MVQDSDSRGLDKVIVRLPDGMRELLKAAAAKNNRSMNAEIVQRLKDSFGVDAESAKAALEVMEKLMSQMGYVRGSSWSDDASDKPQKPASKKKR